jgi:uncharacterized membrane protein (Fun14 family)
MNVEGFVSVGGTIGGGFFAGALIGYALKKVLKILAIAVGLFFAGLAYLHYQQIVSVNWDKVQTKSQGAVATLSNVTIQISNNIDNATHTSHPTHAFETSLGIPLTGSMAMGLAVGFMKG